jgi:hypothetical protein
MQIEIDASFVASTAFGQTLEFTSKSFEGEWMESAIPAIRRQVDYLAKK